MSISIVGKDFNSSSLDPRLESHIRHLSFVKEKKEKIALKLQKMILKAAKGWFVK